MLINMNVTEKIFGSENGFVWFHCSLNTAQMFV
jgi:hypothetical protein